MTPCPSSFAVVVDGCNGVKESGTGNERLVSNRLAVHEANGFQTNESWTWHVCEDKVTTEYQLHSKTDSNAKKPQLLLGTGNIHHRFFADSSSDTPTSLKLVHEDVLYIRVTFRSNLPPALPNKIRIKKLTPIDKVTWEICRPAKFSGG